MLNSTTVIAFIVIFALEAAVIIIGNMFTICVFKTQSGLHLKRTCLLLINLTAADLLVGVGEVIVLITHKISGTGIGLLKLSFAFQAFGSCTSLMFLALISLERAYAVFWPLRHRVTSSRPYIFSIVIVWATGLCNGGLNMLTVYRSQVDSIYATVVGDLLLFFCLAVICASYLSIRSRLNATNPQLQASHSRSTRDQNLRLSKTFYIVVAVSLSFWLPGFVVYTIHVFCWSCFSPILLWFVNALHLANSMVNPFVYSFRMKIFQDSLKKCWKKRQQDIKLGALPVNRQ